MPCSEDGPTWSFNPLPRPGVDSGDWQLTCHWNKGQPAGVYEWWESPGEPPPQRQLDLPLRKRRRASLPLWAVTVLMSPWASVYGFEAVRMVPVPALIGLRHVASPAWTPYIGRQGRRRLRGVRVSPKGPPDSRRLRAASQDHVTPPGPQGRRWSIQGGIEAQPGDHCDGKRLRRQWTIIVPEGSCRGIARPGVGFIGRRHRDGGAAVQ